MASEGLWKYAVVKKSSRSVGLRVVRPQVAIHDAANRES
jgi:hypothetical protein